MIADAIPIAAKINTAITAIVDIVSIISSPCNIGYTLPLK